MCLQGFSASGSWKQTKSIGNGLWCLRIHRSPLANDLTRCNAFLALEVWPDCKVLIWGTVFTTIWQFHLDIILPLALPCPELTNNYATLLPHAISAEGEPEYLWRPPVWSLSWASRLRGQAKESTSGAVEIVCWLRSFPAFDEESGSIPNTQMEVPQPFVNCSYKG